LACRVLMLSVEHKIKADRERQSRKNEAPANDRGYVGMQSCFSVCKHLP
jgi:hypothetical protein